MEVLKSYMLKIAIDFSSYLINFLLFYTYTKKTWKSCLQLCTRSLASRFFTALIGLLPQLFNWSHSQQKSLKTFIFPNQLSILCSPLELGSIQLKWLISPYVIFLWLPRYHPYLVFFHPTSSIYLLCLLSQHLLLSDLWIMKVWTLGSFLAFLNFSAYILPPGEFRETCFFFFFFQMALFSWTADLVFPAVHWDI